MTNQQGAPEALRFTKKPVTIEAIQWTGKNLREVITFTDGPPDTRSHHAGMAWEAYAHLVARDGLKIYTLEGKMLANPGDWIIRGVKGEYYPCKPDIFEATYSPAALVEAQRPAAHVQNPAGIEHVAGDVSKNGPESNMAQQPAPSAAAASKAVLAAIRAANMQLVRTGDDEFILVTYKNAEAQCDGGKCGIGGYCEQCPAARTPADSVTAPATESYVQPVPDKCDRIVWRGNYYHLPPPRRQTACWRMRRGGRWRCWLAMRC